MIFASIFLGIVFGLGIGYFVFLRLRKREKDKAIEKLKSQNISHIVDGKKVNIEEFIKSNTQLSEADRMLSKEEEEKPKEALISSPLPQSNNKINRRKWKFPKILR
jgi:hypothetical protein